MPGEIDAVEHSVGGDVVYQLSSPPAPLNPVYRMIWDLPTVHSIIRSEKPDLIEVNDKYTLAVLSLLYRKVANVRIPIVGFHHERLDENIRIYFAQSKFFKLTYRWMMELICASYDRIICASRYTAEEIEPVSADKIEIINLGTDIEHFRPDFYDDSLRKELADGADKLLLYVGRLNLEKNLGLLPPMMAELERRGANARLVVAGIGQDAHILSESGRSDISLIGFVNGRDEMARMMASADALVFPSVKEPYGLVPLEALASGLPVVCSNQGGVLEYSDTAAVKSLEPTPENFANALLELFEAPREELCRTARKHAEKFSWDNTFEKQLRVYEGLLSGELPR